MIDFNAYWVALPPGGWLKLLAGPDCNAWRPGMASNITEAKSYDEGMGGRNATRVHWSVTGVQSRSVTWSMGMQ